MRCWIPGTCNSWLLVGWKIGRLCKITLQRSRSILLLVGLLAVAVDDAEGCHLYRSLCTLRGDVDNGPIVTIAYSALISFQTAIFHGRDGTIVPYNDTYVPMVVDIKINQRFVRIIVHKIESHTSGNSELGVFISLLSKSPSSTFRTSTSISWTCSSVHSPLLKWVLNSSCVSCKLVSRNANLSATSAAYSRSVDVSSVFSDSNNVR